MMSRLEYNVLRLRKLPKVFPVWRSRRWRAGAGDSHQKHESQDRLLCRLRRFGRPTLGRNFITVTHRAVRRVFSGSITPCLLGLKKRDGVRGE